MSRALGNGFGEAVRPPDLPRSPAISVGKAIKSLKGFFDWPCSDWLSYSF